ncbi:MAG: DUF6624 domain-containing protein [Allosphingosinicella sp.]|uniref:DUF6624 domain-containing protein n=1 Tax=Allosphingosinicella sp. TaxID=2823234 RepID=UPI00392876E9
MIDEARRRRLLDMAARDLALRERLAADGSLFDGYNPDMQTVHEENAAALQEIVAESGWPTAATVGTDGAEAAWLIAQHAIGLPDFQRACLAALKAAGAPTWQSAYLEDRIRTLEGRPQLYGTQFDWNEEGEVRPMPIEDPEEVDARRAAVGLPPLSEAAARMRAESAAEPKPRDLTARRARMDAWARSVGWRD